MINQRKRVAKRLASGLLAGALALGGLAISGGSVVAKTPDSPTTNRFAGSDRYETAVLMARDFTNPGDNGLVIASGETPYDALAASALAGVKNAPILLVRSGSLPESVSDFLDDYKGDIKASSAKIYVVGGTSAIAEAVVEAMKAIVHPGDSTPTSFVRVAGATRYETAAEIAKVSGVTGPTDRVILVNGDNDRWADALSVGALAATNGWPVILSPNSGLNAAAKGAIDRYLDIAGSDELFLIVGGTSVMPASTEAYLVNDLEIPLANVDRRGGADRYQTNLLLNLYGFADLGGGAEVAVASGVAPWDALAASSWAAAGPTHLVIVPSTGLGTSAATLAGALSAGYEHPTDLFVIGGTSAVPNATKTAFSAAASGAVDGALSIDQTDCVEGRTKVDVSSSVALSATQSGWMTANTNEGDFIEVNGVGAVAGDSVARKTTGEFIDAQSVKNWTMTFVTPLALDDEIDVLDIDEGTSFTTMGATEWPRSLTGDACVVTEDDEAAELEIAITTDEDADGDLVIQQMVITASEPVTLSNFDCSTDIDLPGAAAFTADCSVTAELEGEYDAALTSVYATKWRLVPDAADIDLTGGAGGTGVEVAEDGEVIVDASTGGIEDLASVVAEDAEGVVGAADEDAPVAEISASVCLNKYRTAALGGTYGGAASGTPVAASATVGGLTVTDAQNVLGVAGFGYKKGAAANEWDLEIVDSRGLDFPSIAIDSAAKSITVTADVGYHTADDIVTLAGNLGLQNADWTFSGTGALDEDDDDFAGGTKLCYALISLDEVADLENTAVTLQAAGVTITVDNESVTVGATNVLQLCAAPFLVDGGIYCDTYAVIFETDENGEVEFVSTSSATNGFTDINGNTETTELQFDASGGL